MYLVSACGGRSKCIGLKTKHNPSSGLKTNISIPAILDIIQTQLEHIETEQRNRPIISTSTTYNDRENNESHQRQEWEPKIELLQRYSLQLISAKTTQKTQQIPKTISYQNDMITHTILGTKAKWGAMKLTLLCENLEMRRMRELWYKMEVAFSFWR